MVLCQVTMGRHAVSLALSVLAALPAVAACGPDGGAVVPSECAEGGAFTEPACGRVLAAICARHQDGDACADAPAWDSDALPVRCAWADVVTIADPTTCAIESTGGRCVATYYVGEGGPWCIEPCREEPGLDGIGWKASRRGDELLRVTGRDDGCWVGPIDETSLTERPAEQQSYGDCVADVPAPPALCACGPAACAALR